MAETALAIRPRLKDSACRPRGRSGSDCSIRNREPQGLVRPRTSTRKARLSACEHRDDDGRNGLYVAPLGRRERLRKTGHNLPMQRPELEIEVASYVDAASYASHHATKAIEPCQSGMSEAKRPRSARTCIALSKLHRYVLTQIEPTRIESTTRNWDESAKQEMTHKQKYRIHADEPQILAGTDEGANPVKILLSALASCVTTGMVAHTALNGIHIEELESHLEGDIDLRGFLGLDATAPKGYTNIRLTFRVKTDTENLVKLRRYAEFSPVYNTLIHGTNVDIQVEPQ